MANKRVHELAKEFGMTSKELLEHLHALKIPAKNHASTLIEPYVDKIRKELADVIEEKQAEMEAERLKQEEKERKKREAEEAERREEEERLRKEEEARLAEEEEAQRKEEEQHKKEAAKAEEEAKRKDEEARRLAEEEAKRKDEETAAQREKEEEERYRKMADEAEKVEREKRILAEAQAVAVATAKAPTGKRKAKKKAPKEPVPDVAEPVEEIDEEIAAEGDEAIVLVTEGSTVGEFADALGLAHNEIIKQLMLMGEMLTVNQVISGDAMGLIATELGRQIEVSAVEADIAEIIVDDPKDLKPRPPVVTVMGHVDHGKTSLLDAIRETGVAESEAGGITQHIGASVVFKNDKQITFVDTPGHEAFTAMRARGADLTDIAILVVAADDGVMPQTVEAIHHARAAEVPILVAVNKIDKPNADPNRVRQELTEHEIIPEDWGGENVFVDVSAKQLENIDALLEMILLVAEVQELRANPDALASGVVVEAKLDKGRGPVATVLVQRGTLNVGDALVAGTSYGKVRALVDPLGHTAETAAPADPVEILGLNSVPSAGDEFRVLVDERSARDLAEERSLKQRLLAHEKRHVSLDDLFARIQEGEIKDLNIVLKADAQGSIEAIVDALAKMDQAEVRINVIHSGVGGISEHDVTLADASDAVIIGFNVRPNPTAKSAAEKATIDMRLYTVIYQVVEDINAARVGMLEPDIHEEEAAMIEVRETFKVPKAGTIAGCYVLDGEVSRDDQVRLVRDGTIIFDGVISSLRRFKDDVKSVKSGYECGISIKDFQDIKVGDVIEAYRTIEVAREA